jgi:hypothetical protein
MDWVVLPLHTAYQTDFKAMQRDVINYLEISGRLGSLILTVSTPRHRQYSDHAMGWMVRYSYSTRVKRMLMFERFGYVLYCP